MTTKTINPPRVSDEVRRFLDRGPKMLINGALAAARSGKIFPVVDPASEVVIAHVPEAEVADVDVAVAGAREAFEDGRWTRMPPAARERLINRFIDLIEKHGDEIAEIESLDNGKPITVAKAVDIPHSLAVFRYMAGWTTKLTGNTSTISAPGEFLSYTLREPIGVVGQILAWNFPLALIAWKMAPALAAGCTVVLKPAEQTPLSALRLGELAIEAGFPEGVINIVTGFGPTVGAAIASHPDIDKVSFTGSTEVGRLIVKAAAGNLKKVTVELGGKSPVIVLPDADLSRVGPGAAAAIFSNQGQVCCAGSMLYAHKSVVNKVVDRVAEIAEKIKLGPGLDPTSEMGPLVSREQLDRVSGYVDIGRQEGATLVTGGKQGGSGYFMKPTVLADTAPDMRVVREEIFGPVLCVQSFDDSDLEQIAKQANSTPYGLAASIWTRDISAAHKLASRVKAGTVWINNHGWLDPAMPFGGYKQSGWGREHGYEVFHAYTEVKSVMAAL